VAVSFGGGGNGVLEKTAALPQITDKRLPHNVVSSTPHHERDLNSQH
jgi:hypothetical protein